MKLVHYSARPLGEIVSTAQLKAKPDWKPRGFWVSVEGNGDGWKEWCEGEQWGLGKLVRATSINLRSDADILRLSNATDIDAFDNEYGVNAYSTIRYVDWASVSAKHQGIIIAPYVWARRHEGRASNWYYTWDCASGCIWDAQAIAAIEPQVEAA